MNIIKRIFVSAGILAGLLLTSCDLTTESQSTFDEPSVFADPTLTSYQIYSIYEVFGHTNSHRGRYLPWYGYNNDIEWYVSNTLNDNATIVRYSLTRYSGYDPEVDTRRATPLTPGVDYSAYPKSIGYVVGVNLTF